MSLQPQQMSSQLQPVTKSLPSQPRPVQHYTRSSTQENWKKKTVSDNKSTLFCESLTTNETVFSEMNQKYAGNMYAEVRSVVTQINFHIWWLGESP